MSAILKDAACLGGIESKLKSSAAVGHFGVIVRLEACKVALAGVGGEVVEVVICGDVVADAKNALLRLEQTVEVGQFPFVARKVVAVVGLAEVVGSGPGRFLAVGRFF